MKLPFFHPSFRPEERLSGLKAKAAAPVWSESQWQRMENLVLAEIRKPTTQPILTQQKETGFPIWARLGAVAALSLLIILSLLLPNSRATKNVAASRLVPFITQVSGHTTAHLQERLVPGKAIATGKHGSITARLEESTGFILSGLSEVELLEMSPTRIALQLHSGTIELRVAKRKPGQVLQVLTSEATVEVVGTRFKVEAMKDGAVNLTRLTVTEGVVRFYPTRHPEEAVLVRAGESASIRGKALLPPITVLSSGAALKTESSFTEATSITSKESSLLFARNLITQQAALTMAESSGTSKNFKVTILESTDYLVALSRYQSGDYSGAIALLEKLLSRDSLSNMEKSRIMQDRAAALRRSGEITGYAEALETLSRVCCDTLSADNQLWEAILVRSRDLGDFAGAAATLKDYLNRFPRGQWIEEAILKLAEVRYALREVDSSALYYQKFIEKYPTSAALDRALYHLAYIESHEQNNCEAASAHYAKVANRLPTGTYTEDALFWNADCLEKMGNKKEALQTYQTYLSKYPEGRWVTAAKNKARNH